jgi:formate dehydrogenase major subunit/NADH-quinone oxidoreductase subunit G
VLYIAGENPVIAYPDRARSEKALAGAGFVVVQDLFLTETAEKADVVLPVVSFAEKDGTFTSVGRHIQRIRKTIKPVGQSRSDREVLAALIARLGGSCTVDAALLVKELGMAVPAYAGISFEKLADSGYVYPVAPKPSLVPVTATAPAATEGAFALVTGSALYHCGTMSRYGEGPMLVCPAQYVEISRADAARLGLTEGDTVKVKGAGGELAVPVKVGTRMPDGVAFAPYHFADNSINRIATGAPVTWVTLNK